MKREEKFMRMDNGRNHRRRSSPPERRASHFFKLILPNTILDKKLRLPMTFVKDHGDDFSSIVTLSDPNLREWKMGLEKCEGDVWFCEGWDKFIEYYSITKENFLVFRYEGNSKFHVLIFDMSGSEIQYPPHDPNPNMGFQEDEAVSLESSENNNHDNHWNNNTDDDDDDDDDYQYTEEDYTDDDFAAYYSSSPSKSPSPFTPRGRGSFTKFIDHRSKREREREYCPSSKFALRRKRKRRERSVSESDSESEEDASNHRRRCRGSGCCRCKDGRYGIRVKKEEHVEWVRSSETCKSKSYRKRHITARESDRVMQAAREYRSEYPSFRAVLRPHNLYNSFVYVPASFALKYLDGRSELITLETWEGKQWSARCFSRKGSGCGMSIGRGWARFAIDNHIQEGDVCVFELVSRKHIILRVQVFRVSDYADR